METSNGKIYFGVGLDNSQLQQDAAKTTQILDGINKDASQRAAEVRAQLSNIPTVSVDIKTNVSLDTIDAAFAEIDRVVDTNKAAIQDLEREYKRLGEEQNKAANKGDVKSVQGINEQRKAIKEVITVRKQVNKEAAATADELQKEEARLKKEAAATQAATQKKVSFRTELMNARSAMRQMYAAGQQNTEQYEQMRQKVVELTRAMNATNKQTKALASPTAQIQGVISGLQGISGAAAVAQGAVGLFGEKNEKLQKTMMKLQSIMSIVMGLQQVQMTLNKNSAFSMVTLNTLKKLWSKLLGTSATAQAAETAATAANTTAQAANTAATAANTAAQTTNNTATTAGTAAQAANRVGTAAATAATPAQTIATKAATLAMKGLRAALVATGIGALIILVTELVGWLTSLFDATSKADKEFEENLEVTKKGAEAYAKTSVEIENYKTRIENFNGTKKQEQQLVKELNGKYGEALGYYKTLGEWKQTLIEKGDDYCKTLLKEAEAQAILSKYMEAYVHLQEVTAKAEAYKYGSFWDSKTGRWEAGKVEINKAQKELDAWAEKYKATMQEAEKMRQNYGIGGHTDTTTVTPKSGNSTTSSFDPKKAAAEAKKAAEEYRSALKEYREKAQDETDKLVIEGQEQSLAKEINEINRSTAQKLKAWNEQLEKVAELREKAAKAQYMNKKGATEEKWESSAVGKKTTEDWIATIKHETPEVIAEFDRVWNEITANGEKAVATAQQKYHEALINEFGTQEQKEDLLLQKWMKKIATLPAEFVPEAARQMDEAFSKLSTERFKKLIDWESVFGDLSQQSGGALETNLGRVREYFEKNRSSMGTEEIKEFSEAISNMENEIASRNPFAELHKSIKDIGADKAELVTAFNELSTAQQEERDAINECKAAQQEYNDVLDKVQGGEYKEGGEEQVAAEKKLTDAKTKSAKATEKAQKAENKYVSAQNKATKSYKKVASSLQSVGGVITKLGTNAKNLASVFSSDVAKGIEKAMDFMDEMIDAASSVINAVGDVSKSAAKGIETTVESAAEGSTAAADAGAKSISTMEKASVILAVISAALQAATAIANLFNSDASKQEEIEKLQTRIDQLQWELDNAEAARLQKTQGDAMQRVITYYRAAREEILGLINVSTQYSNWWERVTAVINSKEKIRQATVEKLADTYAEMSYTADKALGTAKYDSAREQLENLAEQQTLLYEQMELEESKKKTDEEQVQEYKNQAAEIAEEMANVINEMMEDIFGNTAEDLASELGDAFFEAAAAGEDAMEAWHKKVNEIVADVVQRMLVTQWLEPKIGKIFDDYKDKWFKNGVFQGAEAVQDSADELAADIDAVGEEFEAVYQSLPENVKKLFDSEESRSASAEGIATASQESVDELNGRMTAVQGHTYSINENTKALLTTTNLILQSVINIDTNTDSISDRMATVETSVKEIRNTVNDIALKGIKVK